LIEESVSPVKQYNMTKKNFLADRLFDRPNIKSMSQGGKPRIFINESQDKKLTPIITKINKKKLS
jgi:hypothetical protein